MYIDLDPKQVIKRAMAFPLDDVIQRYAKEQNLPLQVAREHERELKRFLALGAISPELYGMRGPIDNLWHTFVIFTREYAKFCQTVAGKFIHHYPSLSRPEDPQHGRKQALELRKGYRRFLNDYQATFNEPAPKHLWPRLTSERAEYVGGCACTDTDGCDLTSGCTCVDGGTGDETETGGTGD